MGACSIFGSTDKEGGSYNGMGKKCFEVLGERTKEVCFAPGVGLSLKGSSSG